MTDEQIQICQVLEGCRMLPGSWDKKMTSSLFQLSEKQPEKELTDKQNEWMFRLLYKYRRQVPLTYKKHQNNPLCSKK